MDSEFPKQITLKDGTTAVIRKVVADDAESILNFLHEIVEKDDFYVLTTLEDVNEMQMTIEKEVEWIEKHNKDGNVVLVGQIDDKVAGVMSLNNGSRNRIKHVGELHISVLENYRNIGLATALVEETFKWAKRDPLIEKISLGVFADNDRAISLYKKIGFIEQGRMVREVKRGTDDYADCILMYKFVK